MNLRDHYVTNQKKMRYQNTYDLNSNELVLYFYKLILITIVLSNIY